MKKQVRYGVGDRDKARLPAYSIRQVDEIRAITGENLNDVIQNAITERYMRIVYHEQERQMDELKKAYDELYKAHCDLINE